MADPVAWKKHLVTSTVSRDLYINDKPRYVSFTHMGIPYWSFEVHSQAPDVSVVNRLCEDCDEFAMLYRPIGRWGDVVIDRVEEYKRHNSLVFLNCQELNISRAMYDRAVPKWPLKVKVSYCYRSGPHATCQVELAVPGREGQPLVSRMETVSYIDASTRRLAAAPPTFSTDELDGKETRSHGLRVERLPRRPADAYMRRVLILYSHCDRNSHASYRVYLALCLETLQHAITSKEVCDISTNSGNDRSNALELPRIPAREGVSNPRSPQPRWLTSEVLRHGVKTARQRFLGETVVGEELCVYLWQEEHKPRWVFFSMESENSSRSRVRFEMSLEYFGPPAKL